MKLSVADVRKALAGPAGVGVGTVILGASGYGFLTLTAGAVSESDYAGLASLYLLVALVGPGMFMALEQETIRVVTQRLARGEGTRDSIAQLVRVLVVLLGVAVVGLAALAPLLINRVFLGDIGLWFALLVSVVGYGATSVPRGVLAAHRRLGAYGRLLGVDGAVRLLPCIVFAAAGVTNPVPYGLALGFGPVASLVVALLTVRFGEPGPRLEWRALITGASWLAVAWAANIALANVAPVIVTSLLPQEPGRAGTFAFAFVLVRIPLFILFALQPVLLPALTHAVASHDIAGLRRGTKQALLLVGGLGVLVLLLTAPIGRWLVHVLFRDSPAPSVAVFTLLAAGTVLAMLVQVLQPALLAVSSHRMVAVGWIVGVLAFAAAFALPIDPVDVATVAQLAAGVATAVIMALALRRHLITPASPGGRVGRHHAGALSERREAGA